MRTERPQAYQSEPKLQRFFGETVPGGRSEKSAAKIQHVLGAGAPVGGTGAMAGNAAAAPGGVRQAFQSFGHAISDGFSAFKEKVGNDTKEIAAKYENWKAERAEVREQRRLAKCAVLDQRDAAQAKLPDNLKDGDFARCLSEKNRPLISVLLSELNAKVEEELASDPTKDPAEVRHASLKKVLIASSVDAYQKLDLAYLRKCADRFHREGRTDKSMLLKEFCGVLNESHTPQGAMDMFFALAKDAIRDTEPHLFLRASGTNEARAIQKFLKASGLDDYVDEVIHSFAKLSKSREARALAQLMKDENASHSTSGLSPMLADALGNFSLKIAEATLEQKMPDSLKGALESLTHEIGLRKEDDETKNTMIHRLYTDQLFLKGIAIKALGSKHTLGQGTNAGFDIVNKVASQSPKPNGYMSEMTRVYQEIAPQIHTMLELYLARAGMPESASVERWEDAHQKGA
ncbi:hypothetical protein [Rhizobium oryzicola]|uniref:Uncharacterized protein n=1 Tax=Rhizobium oryzicola TaxID=1232668 RepID=A0ABT8T3Q2_9HYPH|nr:hypothetical protein [Rhizobium oryzicola]MDO1585064.1 hypothetical protein [Rhizobium oryzicola]